jgi:hypothetical protein
MKVLMLITATAVAFAGATPVGAQATSAQRAAVIQDALRSTAALSANSPEASRRPQDGDQGDDSAAALAKLRVCTKDTPASQRSAICNRVPVSD